MAPPLPCPEDAGFGAPVFYQSTPRERHCRRLGRSVLLSLACVLVLLWSVNQRAYIAQVLALIVKYGTVSQPTVSYRLVQAQYTLWSSMEFNVTTQAVTRLGAMHEFSTARIAALVSLCVAVPFLCLAIVLCVFDSCFEKRRCAEDAKTQSMYTGVRDELRMWEQRRRFEQACHALALTPDSQDLSPPCPSPGTTPLEASNPLGETAHSNTELAVSPMEGIAQSAAPVASEEVLVQAVQTTLGLSPPADAFRGEGNAHDQPAAGAMAASPPDHHNGHGQLNGASSASVVVVGSVMETAHPFAMAQWPDLAQSRTAPGQHDVESSFTGFTVEAYHAHLTEVITSEHTRRAAERVVLCLLLALAIALDVMALLLAINVHAVLVPLIEKWVNDSAGRQDPSVQLLEMRSSPTGVLAVIAMILSLTCTILIASGRAVGVRWLVE